MRDFAYLTPGSIHRLLKGNLQELKSGWKFIKLIKNSSATCISFYEDAYSLSPLT
jgi:hypothetical protein